MLDVLNREIPPAGQELPTIEKTAGAKSRQVVLVFQGGGALGAYQAGVYQALHESQIEPDWIIGTSIGAINASGVHPFVETRQLGTCCVCCC